MRGFGLPVPGWVKGEKKAGAVRRKKMRLRRNKRKGEQMPQGTVKGAPGSHDDDPGQGS